MEKEFVPENLVEKLKELGYNGPIIISYMLFGEYKPKVDVIQRITFSQAFGWFREKGYDVKVIKESPGLYFGFYWNGAAWIMVGNGTYEASELACLDKLLEIVEFKS